MGSLSTYTTEDDLRSITAPIDLGGKRNRPNQPHLPDFPKRMFEIRNCSFPVFHYNNIPWVEYFVQQDAVFCFRYCHFHSETGYVDDSFIKNSVQDWKKISEKLYNHAVSYVHVKCMEK